MHRCLSVLVLMSVVAVTVNLIAVEPIPRPCEGEAKHHFDHG